MLDNRFWDKVKTSGTNFYNGTPCQEWIAGKIKGYGPFSLNGKPILAHRASYEDVKGKIPEGLELDHLCRNPKCVNSEHLEAVTHKENLLRGDTIASKNSKKTHCPKGHEYSEENTLVTSQGRQCRICNMSKITINIKEELKKWLLDVAEDSLVFENMSDVVKFAIKYVRKNPEVLPK